MFDEPGLRYSHQAMRTTFEFFFPSPHPNALLGLAEDCASEISEIELSISPYQEGSDIHRLNCNAGTDEWIRVGWPTIKLLKLCQTIMIETDGAFNPFDGHRSMQMAGKLLDSQTQSLIKIENTNDSYDCNPISFSPVEPLAKLSQGHLIDLGAIGKGWALDRCADLIRENGIARAFIHAGGSSMIAFGPKWPVRIADTDTWLELCDTSISVSRLNNTDAGGVHIVTKCQYPLGRDIVASVKGPSCAITDALSTAIVAGLAVDQMYKPDYVVDICSLPTIPHNDVAN
jgi:thiamine biosynthesis lipoprotein